MITSNEQWISIQHGVKGGRGGGVANYSLSLYGMLLELILHVKCWPGELNKKII